jgi:nitrogen regulatory protein PII
MRLKPMKKIEAIIKSFKLEEVKAALSSSGEVFVSPISAVRISTEESGDTAV